MRHGVKNKKLGVDAEHKRAILRSLATSILLKGLEKDPVDRQVRTTLFKAKLVSGVVDRLVTYAKKGDLSARRQAARFVMDPDVLKGLFNEIGPRYASRAGGYTRVLKLGLNRAGDASEMALIGLVEDEIKVKAEKKAPVKKASTKKVDIAGAGAEVAKA
jgi:large subunit ribosomal protein L17